MKKLFTEGFIAVDIAEPLMVFDNGKKVEDVTSIISANELEVVGINVDGLVAGFALCQGLASGCCGDHMLPFNEEQVVDDNTSIARVIDILSRSQHCFVSMLGGITAVITQRDMQKPPVRMWLFGMISIIEMYIVRVIETKYPSLSWCDKLSPKRLELAEDLHKDRKRWGQQIKLLECLHLSDKANIIIKDPEIMKDFGFDSKSIAKKNIREFQSLRNNLAHAHDIVTYNWDSIVKMAKRLDKIMTRIV
jgi:hypothetical protein